jgi:hypothetical protein
MKFLPLVVAQPDAPEEGADFTLGCDSDRVRAVRRADGGPGGVQHGGGDRRRRPAHDDPQGVDHPAAARSYADRASRRSTAWRSSPTRTGSARTTGIRTASSRTWRSSRRAGCEMYPEFELPEDQKRPGSPTAPAPSSAPTSRGGSTGRSGIACPLISPIYRKPDGSPGTSRIDGIYDSDREGHRQDQVFFHWEYLNETFMEGRFFDNWVGWYVIRVADPDRSDELAQRIDAMFANSPAETKTATEKAFVADFANQVGDIGAIMMAITAIVMGFITVRRGQRHGAVDPRANQRARRAEDARLHRRPDPGAGAAGVLHDRARRRWARPGRRVGCSSRRVIRPAACCPPSTSRRDLVVGGAAARAARPRRRGCCRRDRRSG